MSFEQMPDERLSHFYENIRQQVEADRANKHQFMSREKASIHGQPDSSPICRKVAKRNDQAAIEALADRVALAVSDPTRSLADPGALDRSTNSRALVSLAAAGNRLCSKCSSALGRSSGYSTGSSAADSRHSTSAEPGRRPVR